MKAKGLISFVLVLVFVSSYLAIANSQNKLIEGFGESKALMLEMEQANLARTLLEQNTDKIIRQTIQIETLKKNTEPEILREKISENLFSFFKQMEENSDNPKIEFFESKTFSKAETALLAGKKEKLSKKFLKESIKVNVVSAKGVHLVECAFTGGILKNQQILAKISTLSTESVFLIPIDSSQIVEAIG